MWRKPPASVRAILISSTNEILARLERISPNAPLVDQLLQLAGLIALALQDSGLFPVIVGGSAVALYTKGSESTTDVDFVVEGYHRALEIMKALGFEERTKGTLWYPRLNLPIEIPSTVLAGDLGRVRNIELDDGLIVHVIGIEDLILDRVDQAAAQGSPSGDARRQALLLLATYGTDLDTDYLLREALRRRTSAYLQELRREVES